MVKSSHILGLLSPFFNNPNISEFILSYLYDYHYIEFYLLNKLF